MLDQAPCKVLNIFLSKQELLKKIYLIGLQCYIVTTRNHLARIPLLAFGSFTSSQIPLFLIKGIVSNLSFLTGIIFLIVYVINEICYFSYKNPVSRKKLEAAFGSQLSEELFSCIYRTLLSLRMAFLFGGLSSLLIISLIQLLDEIFPKTAHEVSEDNFTAETDNKIAQDLSIKPTVNHHIVTLK